MSSHRSPIRKRPWLTAATVSHLVSVPRQILFRSRARTTGLAIGTAVVAAISLGTALLWPASPAPNPGGAASRAQTITAASGAVATIDADLDARRARAAELVRFLKTQARKAAERKAAAARAAAARLAQQQAAQAQAAQSSSAGTASSGSGSSGSGSSGSGSPQPSGSPQQIASAMLGSYGWGQDQFGCLDALWSRESGWNPQAANPDGAYGIPQALPGAKMASAGPDWQTNPATQIRWGLGYIQGLYGSPCGAWAHEQSTGWY